MYTQVRTYVYGGEIKCLEYLPLYHRIIYRRSVTCLASSSSSSTAAAASLPLSVGVAQAKAVLAGFVHVLMLLWPRPVGEIGASPISKGPRGNAGEEKGRPGGW